MKRLEPLQNNFNTDPVMFFNNNFVKASLLFGSTIITSFFLKAATQETNSLMSIIEKGKLALPGVPNAIAVQNNYLFIATLSAGLQIVDVNNSSNPILVGNYSTFDQVHDVKISGNYAFLAEDYAGLKVLDITNKSNPFAVGIYSTGYAVTNVEVKENEAWLMSNDTLTLIDVSSPENIFNSAIKLSRSVNHVIFLGTHAYVTASGLFSIIDVSEVTKPFVSGSYLNSYVINALEVVGSIAYATAHNGLFIFDVSNASNPVLLSQNFNSTCFNGMSAIALSDKIAYLSCNSELLVANLTNPLNPKVLGQYSTINGNRIIPSTITVSGDLAYITTGSWQSLIIIDIANTTNLTILSNTTGPFSEVKITANIAYVAGAPGLHIFDVSNPQNPIALGVYSAEGGPFRVVTSNSLAYLACGKQGVHIINVSDPNNPVLLSAFQVKDGAYDVDVSGNLIYVAGGTSGLIIIDATKPDKKRWEMNLAIKDTAISTNSLILVTNFGATTFNFAAERAYYSIATMDTISEIVSTNSIAYIAENSAGLQIMNTSYLSQTVISNYSTFGKAADLTILGSVAYLADDSFGLLIINITDLTKPVLLGSYAMQGGAKGVTIEGDFAYLLNAARFQIVNISRLNQPVLTGTYNISGEALDYVVSGNTAYFINYKNFQIIDVTNKSAPNLLGGCDCPGNLLIVLDPLVYIITVGVFNIFDISNKRSPTLIKSFIIVDSLINDIYISGNLGYLTCETNGIHLIDISDRLNPVWLGSYDVHANRLSVSGKSIYTAYYSAGLTIRSLWDAYLLMDAPIKIASSSNLAYVIDATKKLHGLDLQNTSSLIRFSLNYTLSDIPNSIVISDKFLYAAEGSSIEVVNIYRNQLPKFDNQIVGNFFNITALAVNNTHLYIGDASAELIIYYIQGNILIDHHQLTLESSERLIITSNELSAESGPGIDPTKIKFIISNLEHGQFELLSQSNITITSFDQQTINQGIVIFAHDGSDFAPIFQVSLSDGVTVTSPVNVTINFNSINSPPQIVTNQLAINEGERVILTKNDLSATDKTTPSDQLKIITNKVKHGRFEASNLPGVSMNLFFQQNITDGQIIFVHTGGSFDKPSYEIIANDGELDSVVSIVIVDFNAAPHLITNQLTLQQGSTVVLSNNELQASDIDDDNATLLFIITNIHHGSFNQNNFTQQLITDGKVQFIHDGSENKPEYLVSVADKRMQTAASAAVTSLTQNASVTDNTLPIIAGSTAGAGVLVLSGAIMLTFWCRKTANDKTSRETYELARFIRRHLQLRDVDNFESEQGKQFTAAVQKLEMALQQRNINLMAISSAGIESLAQHIATSARNKITHSTKFGKSIITVLEFENKLTDIADDIALSRGINDNSIEMGRFK